MWVIWVFAVLVLYNLVYSWTVFVCCCFLIPPMDDCVIITARNFILIFYIPSYLSSKVGLFSEVVWYKLMIQASNWELWGESSNLRDAHGRREAAGAGGPSARYPCSQCKQMGKPQFGPMSDVRTQNTRNVQFHHHWKWWSALHSWILFKKIEKKRLPDQLN